MLRDHLDTDRHLRAQKTFAVHAVGPRHRQILAPVRPLGEGNPVDGLDAGERFDTVVLTGALEFCEPAGARELVSQAFELLAPNGRLLVCVPHEDHEAADDRRQCFTRSGLKKLLKRIEQPKVFTDQPYRWLLMGLERDPVPDHASRERCRVLTGLCRGVVLELGCGPGHLSGAIADRGLTVTGVDMNAPKIEKARRRYHGAQ